jgi:hypothetical protein
MTKDGENDRSTRDTVHCGDDVFALTVGDPGVHDHDAASADDERDVGHATAIQWRDLAASAGNGVDAVRYLNRLGV